jgi:hypothetical protein
VYDGINPKIMPVNYSNHLILYRVSSKTSDHPRCAIQLLSAHTQYFDVRENQTLPTGWIRLEKGQPAQRVKRGKGEHFPTRAELGETDLSLSPISSLNQEPQDPSRRQHKLSLVTEAADDETHRTTARDAVVLSTAPVTEKKSTNKRQGLLPSQDDSDLDDEIPDHLG